MKSIVKSIVWWKCLNFSLEQHRQECLYHRMRTCILGILSPVFFFQSCANAVAPTGGAPDKTPPQILASEPIQRALNVHPTAISLLFNTFIAQRERVQQSIFLTPPVRTEYSWVGKTLYISFKEPLDSNTTVALTLGTEYTNWDGNKPEAAYTLTFSTGSKLDSGIIRGTIDQQNTDKRDGISAFLYPLTGIKPDTLNPSTTKPKYKTQLGSKGTFEFPALARGAYRLFVVRDEFRNDVIDVGTDAFGTTTRDISLSEGATADVRVQLAPKTDALPPQLYEVRHISPKRVLVRFNEKIEATSLRASAWTLRDSARRLPIAALDTSVVRAIPRITQLHAETNNPAAIIVYLDKPPETSLSEANTRWEMRTTMVRDSAGNVINDTANTGFFSMNTTPPQTDTAAPMLVRTVLANAPPALQFFASAPPLSDSARGVPLQPQIAFVFSSALQHNLGEASNDGTLLKNIESNIIVENSLQQAISVRIVPSKQVNTLVVEPVFTGLSYIYYQSVE
jgi:Bacterial Ig-like domain